MINSDRILWVISGTYGNLDVWIRAGWELLPDVYRFTILHHSTVPHNLAVHTMIQLDSGPGHCTFVVNRFLLQGCGKEVYRAKLSRVFEGRTFGQVYLLAFMALTAPGCQWEVQRMRFNFLHGPGIQHSVCKLQLHSLRCWGRGQHCKYPCDMICKLPWVLGSCTN